MSEIQEVDESERILPEEDLQVIKRHKNDPEELRHQNQIEMLQAAFPNKFIDPLMASVLLKTPPERLAELLKQPELWITPEQQDEQVLMGCITIE